MIIKRVGTMGSYCSFIIKERELFWSKSYIPTDLCILFHQSELKRSSVKVMDDDEEYDSEIYLLESTSTKLLDRLRILGYSPEQAYIRLSKALNEYIHEYGEILSIKFDVDVWCSKITEIVNSPLIDDFEGDDVARYILYHSDFTLGLPSYDERDTLVLLLSLFTGETRVALDYSELVGGGYIEDEEDVVSKAKLQIQNSAIVRENIIIVAEGVTDLRYLEKSLKILFPDLVNYFSFFDIKGPKVQGGVDDLVRFVKGVLGAKLSNRFCVIFDNDFAGLSGMEKLKKISVPSNVTIMHYPDMPLFNSYPVTRDNQLNNMNINGVGCSIELYFGKDILISDNCLTPVRITHINGKIHGKISNKAMLQSRFLNKCRRTLIHGIDDAEDWSGMISVWNTIFDNLSVSY